MTREDKYKLPLFVEVEAGAVIKFAIPNPHSLSTTVQLPHILPLILTCDTVAMVTIHLITSSHLFFQMLKGHLEITG